LGVREAPLGPAEGAISDLLYVSWGEVGRHCLCLASTCTVAKTETEVFVKTENRPT